MTADTLPLRSSVAVLRSSWLWTGVLLFAAICVAAFSPLEQTLGASARLVYFHGAWVWVGLLVFMAAAFAGLLGLLVRKPSVHHWSRALGRTGLIFWLVFLLMSLYLMQISWNGLFLLEPRFRIPFNFAIVSILLQLGLSLLPAGLISSAGNLFFGLALAYGMRGIDTVLHPVSPILNSSARDIQAFFLILLVLLLLSAWQMACVWMKAEHKV